MYPPIAEFLEHDTNFLGCETAINKITFDILKGWKIDVAGIVHDRNKYVIAVEAKNEISPGNILQGISQAEMYQKVCNEAYLALPNNEIEPYKKTNHREWDRIINLCEAKGIGIISVATQWQDCKIISKAVPTNRYSELYEEIVNQLEYETLYSFKGFERIDLDYFSGKAAKRKDIVKKKIQLLVEGIEKYVQTHPKDFPAIDSRRLVVNLPVRGFRRDDCWFFLAESEKKDLASVPHFTFHVRSDEVDCMITMESLKVTNMFIQKLKSEPDIFLTNLKKLHDINEEYKVIIWEQIHEKKRPRRKDWPWHLICSFNVGYVDHSTVKFLIETLSKINYPVVRILCPTIKLGDPSLYTAELVTKCTEWVKELQDVYTFLAK